LLSGCAAPPPPDDLVKQRLRCWQEASALLEGVRDEAGLAAAEKELDRLAQRIVELNKKEIALHLDERAKRDLDAEHRKEADDTLRRFGEAARKLHAIPGGEATALRFRRMASRLF